MYYQQNNHDDLYLKPQTVNYEIVHVPPKVEVHVFIEKNYHLSYKLSILQFPMHLSKCRSLYL